MFRYTCLNPIAQTGLDGFSENYQKTEELNDADAILVRSAKMHEMELPKSVCAIARAGAGVNNIPLGKYADQGIVVFNTPGANANGVKELVFAGMLLAARDIIGGANWTKGQTENPDVTAAAEKVCRYRASRKEAWYHRTWCDRCESSKRRDASWHGCLWVRSVYFR